MEEEHDILERILDGRMEPTDLPLSLLKNISGNFCNERKIGDGGFALVYKGVLQNGEVAVKRIRNNKTIDETLFRQEVNSLMNVNHRNIVRFLGFCSNTEHKAMKLEGSREYIYAESRERILCFEYTNNGSLDRYITDELRGLKWSTRYNIIKGICDGLEYLHMKKLIIHMDLKPANILLDNHMMAKITDFGLARMAERSHTQTANRKLTLGYCAPEYLHGGRMSVKSDVYSLGIIIMELVTGRKDISDNNNVLRRWRHRWHKSGEETPFKYRPIVKLIEIGLRCQDHDPYKRPFISDIIHDINELERTDRPISNANESTVGQISPYSENDMLGIEPLELPFPFDPNKQISCSLELTNEINAYIAFSISTTSPLPYCIQPSNGVVQPQSKRSVNITLLPQDKAPQDKQYNGDFIVRSTKVDQNLTAEDITEEIFNRKEGKVVDEVTLTVAYEAEVPKVDLPLESLAISDTINLNSRVESNVPPAEAESKIISSTSDDLIQFDPPELRFPLLPNKKVVSSVKVVNITDFYVGFNVYYKTKNAAWYTTMPDTGVLAPRSTQILMVQRKLKEDALKDKQPDDNYFVWNSIMVEGMQDINLSDYMDDEDSKKLPIILTEVSPCTSNELILFDPPELSFPFLPNKPLVSSVNVVNVTDCYVGFNVLLPRKNTGSYMTKPCVGILPPRSTQRMAVKREPKQRTLEDMEHKDELSVWNMIVAEGVEARNLNDYMDLENCKELPIVLKEISPCTPDDLIRFDPPELRFTFLPNKTLLSSVNIVNITDYYVGFNIWLPRKNAAWHRGELKQGILLPRSTQKIVRRRVPKEKELEDMHFEDKFFVWNGVVSEGVEASDLSDYTDDEESKELPIILKKIGSSAPHELIQFEPTELRFPLLPNKSLVSSFKITNVTDYHVGFTAWAKEGNEAVYSTDPTRGILPPRSTQELAVSREAKGDALDDIMHCKDRFFVWSTFVTEGVTAIDLEGCVCDTESKELPIVFTEIISNELIQFDPPKLCFPLLPNQSVLSSAKIVNVTDHYVGFNICTRKSNSASYYTNPSEGVLPPRCTQILMVTRIAEEKELEDTQWKDKYLVWNGIATQGVKASDVIGNMSETKITELPIVLTKTGSSTSDELIRFDPPELSFPLLPNRKVMSSIKIVNITDYNVGFNTYSKPTNAAWYHTQPPEGILRPQCTQKLLITREQKEDASEPMHFNDKYFVWNRIVTEGVKESDLGDYMADQESKELPIVLNKICSSTSDELIRFAPAAELHFRFSQISLCSVNMINLTEFYVAFNEYSVKRNPALHKKLLRKGILTPRSTEKLHIIWTPTETELEEMEPGDKIVVWNRVVTEGVEAEDIVDYMDEEESTELRYIFNKTSPSEELIQFDPPELSFPFLPNKPSVSLVNIVNCTDHLVAFRRRLPKSNAGWYDAEPWQGVMPPRSAQRLLLKRTAQQKEQGDLQCEDKLFLWNKIATEGAEVSDIIGQMDGELTLLTKALPIVLQKTSLCTSDDLLHFDPPELRFPFMPNKRVSMLCLLKIVNVTDSSIGYNIWVPRDSSAAYLTEPDVGIMPPQSTQIIKVTRTPKEKEPEDMQCKDKIFVWRGIVTEGVEVSDVRKYWKDEDKELPIILTNTILSATEELIQLDPPELCFPFVPNRRVSMLCLVKIVNVTDHSIRFSTWVHDDNSALYKMEPDTGILPPQSTQVIKVKRTTQEKKPEDIHCKDKVGVLSSIVTEGVEVGDVWSSEYQDTELPIILTKARHGVI